MAQRGRKKRKKPTRRPERKPLPTAPEPGMSRTEAKNAAARARLEPLAEGERPLPVTIGAAVAAALVVVQIPLYFLFDGDERPPATGFIAFIGLMTLMAWGMWKVKYWAVLGFQALLALCILIFSLLLVRFEDAIDVVIALAVIVPGSVLFFHMVKALARIQMPER